ncbi:TlpA family protein disulfide reductase [Flavobacteriaceae bacterium]|nr:TlpA family protein disulfide reductase [Flavobacteriaceae bacterium]
MKQLLVFIFILFYNGLIAQSIKGQFLKIPNQTIKLEGFNGLKTYPISLTTTDVNGKFELSYSKTDYGVGYLMAVDNKPLFVILSGEEIELAGESLSNFETIKIKKGQENQYFEQFANEHPKREQALSAWLYLEKIYATDTLFAVQKHPVNAIKKEKLRIKNEDAAFLDALPNESYVKWFLPTRKLVSSVSTVVQYRPEGFPEMIKAFRNLDYADTRLYKSGLFKDAIESHFWLLENSGNPLDNVFEEMKISIDAIFTKLSTNEKIFNQLTDYLFDLLERHSLFQASEYLALKVLNEGSCTITDDLANQLETYRAMKKGNIAADMVFDKTNFVNPKITLTKLSDIKSNYTVVVFGASWCPKCNEELPEITKRYDKWKSKGIEVIFVAIEEGRNSFIDFAESLPFPSYSDVKKWESKIVKDYYIFSTPTMFLLDSKREIILRPNSVNQMDAWVNRYLIQEKTN